MKHLPLPKFLLIIFFTFYWQSNGEFRFTNIVCKALDKTFADFEYCYLKAVNRTYSYTSLKVRLLKVPITNVTVKFGFYKRANGYKPFLYKGSIDACKFLLNTKQNPVFKYFYDMFLPYTNMNHTCPFDHDLLVEKVGVSYMENQLTHVLPMPHGEYLIQSSWMAYNKNYANISVYFRLSG